MHTTMNALDTLTRSAGGLGTLRRSSRGCRRALRLLVLAAGLLGSAPAEAFERPIHDQLTKLVLKDWSSRVVTQVAQANLEQDNLCNKSDAHHFNDCAFAASSTFIRERYAAVVVAVTAAEQQGEANCSAAPCPNLDAAARAFGAILHAIQDFYAHSNWLFVDAQLAFGELGEFPEIRGQLGGHVVLEGDLAAAPADGLLSGSVGNIIDGLGGGVCSRGLEWGHWDSDGGLHNDNAKRPNFERAFALAQRQTEHEVRRLESLLGQRARDYLRSQWSAGAPLASGDVAPSRGLPALRSQPRGSLFSSSWWWGVHIGGGAVLELPAGKTDWSGGGVAYLDVRAMHWGVLIGVSELPLERVRASLVGRVGRFGGPTLGLSVDAPIGFDERPTGLAVAGYELVPAGAFLFGSLATANLTLAAGIAHGNTFTSEVRATAGFLF